jgi:hypothetical protein
MSVSTEMHEGVARWGIAFVAYFLAFLDFTVLAHPNDTVGLKFRSLIIDPSITLLATPTGVDKAGRW